MKEKPNVESILVNMAYASAFAAERMILVLEKHLNSRGERLRHDKKYNFGMLRKSLQAAKRYYDFAFDDDLIRAVYNSGEITDWER